MGAKSSSLFFQKMHDNFDVSTRCRKAVGIGEVTPNDLDASLVQLGLTGSNRDDSTAWAGVVRRR
jgi:hypothetical protein